MLHSRSISSLSSRSEEADQKAGLGVGAGAGARAKTSGDRSVAVPLLSLTVAWNKLKYIRSGQHTAQNGNFRISPNRILHDTLCLLIKFFRPFYTMYRRSLPNACEYRATFRSSRLSIKGKVWQNRRARMTRVSVYIGGSRLHA